MFPKPTKVLLCVLMCIVFVICAYAHPGRTDSNGGHHVKGGGYHYHHGYPAHQHDDGICPYNYDDQTGRSSGSSGSNKIASDTLVETPKETENKNVFLEILKVVSLLALELFLFPFVAYYSIAVPYYIVWGIYYAISYPRRQKRKHEMRAAAIKRIHEFPENLRIPLSTNAEMFLSQHILYEKKMDKSVFRDKLETFLFSLQEAILIIRKNKYLSNVSHRQFNTSAGCCHTERAKDSIITFDGFPDRLFLEDNLVAQAADDLVDALFTLKESPKTILHFRAALDQTWGMPSVDEVDRLFNDLIESEKSNCKKHCFSNSAKENSQSLPHSKEIQTQEPKQKSSPAKTIAIILAVVACLVGICAAISSKDREADAPATTESTTQARAVRQAESTTNSTTIATTKHSANSVDIDYDETVYVETASKRFHRASCSVKDNSKEMIVKMTRREAVKNKNNPCSACFHD